MVRALKADLKTCHGDIRHREEIYHAIPSVVAVVQSGLITNVNESATDQLGYAPGDLLGRSFLDMVHPQSRDMVREIHTKRLDRKNVPEQYEADMMTKSGLPFPCEVRVRKILLAEGGRSWSA